MDLARTTIRRLLYLLPEGSEQESLTDAIEANLCVPLEARQIKELRQKISEALRPLAPQQCCQVVVDLLAEATPYEADSLTLRQERLWRQVLLAPAPHIDPVCLDESPSDDDEGGERKHASLRAAVAEAKAHATTGLAELEQAVTANDSRQAAVAHAKKVLRACRIGLGMQHRATGQAARLLADRLLRLEPMQDYQLTELQHALTLFARSGNIPTVQEVIVWLPQLDLWASKVVQGDATLATDLAQGRDLTTVITCCLAAENLHDQHQRAHLDQLMAWAMAWNQDGMAQRPDRREGQNPAVKARVLAKELLQLRQPQAAQRILARCHEAQQGSHQSRDAAHAWLEAVCKLYRGTEPDAPICAHESFFTRLPLQTSDQRDLAWLHQRRDDFMLRSQHLLGHQHTKKDLFAWALDFVFGHTTHPLCLVGSPGIGKSALLQHFCSALFAPAQPVVLDVKGWTGAAALKGWEQKYVAAQPGEIAMALMNRGAGPCVVIFDDIDHAVQAAGQSSSEIQETIGQVMAKEPFLDLFFGFPLKLDKCFFFATANRFDLLAPHLQRRLAPKKMSLPDQKTLARICRDALVEALTRRHILEPIDDTLIDYFVGKVDDQTGIAPVLAEISDFASFFSRLSFEGSARQSVYDESSLIWREANQSGEDPCQHPIYGALVSASDGDGG